MSDPHIGGFPDFEMSLGSHEVEEFRDSVVFRSIDRLWGGSFINEAVPTDQVEIKKTVIGPDETTKLTLGGYCILDQIEPESDEVVAHVAHVGVDDLQPTEMVQDLAEQIKCEYELQGLDTCLVEDLDGATVWMSRNYDFFAGNGSTILEVEHAYLLMDLDGDYIYDPRLNLYTPKDTSDCTEKFFEIVEELGLNDSVLKVEDTLRIRTALSMLGLGA